MTERYILIFDDNTGIIKNFETIISQIELKLIVKGYSDSEKFAKVISNPDIIEKTRVIIFDLARNEGE